MKKRIIAVAILLAALALLFWKSAVAVAEPSEPSEAWRKSVDAVKIAAIEAKTAKQTEREARELKLAEKAQKRAEREHQKELERIAAEAAAVEEEEGYTYSYAEGGHLTPSGGVYWYGNQKETYYNLDMTGVIETAKEMGFGGDYWIRDDGCKMLGEYIIVACNRDVHPYGSIVETSLGLGISLDTGGFAAENPYQVDIAVNW